MAYGNWSSLIWKEVWKRMSDPSGGTVLCYSIQVGYKYRQDRSNNKTQLNLYQIYLGQHISGWGMSGCTLHGQLGTDTYSSPEKTTTISGGPPNGIYLTINSSIEVTHDKNGNFSDKIHWRCWVDSSDSHRPNITSWQSFSPSIPKIDREAPVINVRVISKTMTNVTVNITSNKDCDLVQYSLNAGKNWVDTNITLIENMGKSFVIDGLSPGTDYGIHVRARRMLNGVYSEWKQVLVKTDNPPAPSVGNVYVSKITSSTATVTWSGFNAHDLARIVQYSWSLDNKNWNYVNVADAGSSILISGLKEETEYTLYFCAKDNYGTWSSNATAQFTTLVDQLKLKVNVGGVTKIGKVFVNVSGTPKKVKKAFVNVNGQPKKAV